MNLHTIVAALANYLISKQIFVLIHFLQHNVSMVTKIMKYWILHEGLRRRMEYLSLSFFSKNNELLLTATITTNSDPNISKNVKWILSGAIRHGRVNLKYANALNSLFRVYRTTAEPHFRKIYKDLNGIRYKLNKIHTSSYCIRRLHSS